MKLASMKRPPSTAALPVVAFLSGMLLAAFIETAHSNSDEPASFF